MSPQLFVVALVLAVVAFAAATVCALRSMRRARENEMLTAVANRTDNLVFVIDAKARIEWVNPSFERVSGYTLREARGRSPCELLAGPETERATLLRIHERIAAGAGLAGLEVLNYAKSGQPYWVELELQPQKDARGRVLRFIGIESVITARRAAAQALASAKQEAEAANLAKSRFLSRASHELRTPLNAILGFTQLLEQLPRGTALDERHRWQLQLIESSGRHLLALIEDTLDLSRIEAGELRIDSRPFDVAKQCRRALDHLHAEAGRAGVRLVRCFDGAPVWARGDPLRVSQVLLNLLSNAIKYNRRGGSVWLDVRDDGRDVMVSVRDSGVGLSEEQLGGLFQPFNRAGAEKSQIPGTGIGLSIARRLALLMGGDIGVASRVGEGSVFTFTLPAAQAPAVPSDSGFTPLDFAAPAGVRGHVLYVENDAVNAQFFGAALEAETGIDVAVVPNGETAIERLRECGFDLVVVDVNLPGGDGIALIAQVAAIAGPRLPIVALSADATPATRTRALAAGCREYWLKPIAPGRLAAGVTRLLGERADA